MSSSSRRPLTTYSRRRSRARQQHTDAAQSSPIRPLSPDAEDVSFALMAHRMNKRARLVAHPGAIDASHAPDASGEIPDDRPSKRNKRVFLDPPGHLQSDDPLQSVHMLDDPGQTDLQLVTPLQSIPSDCSMALSSVARLPITQDQLLPLPVARKILSRTSSRNFKENTAGRKARSLASPFNSRPSSRAHSPDKNTRKRLGQHVKSRTLSQSGALREKLVDPNVHPSQWNDGGPLPSINSTITGISGNSVNQGNPLAAHTRASSIPTLKPALDHIPSDTWLVPPKVVARSPPAAESDPEGDKTHDMDLDIEDASFYRDAPMQISTPPRRRRSATVGMWAHGLMPQIEADPPPPVRSFRYDSDVDMTDSSCPGSPSDSRSNRMKPPRRRRRTIVHMPSDSLFSSSLDFSALMSETERFPRPPASEGVRSPEVNLPTANSDLGPAFSLQGSPVEQTRGSTGRAASVAHLGPSRSGEPVAADEDDALPAPPPSSPTSGCTRSRIRPDVEGDELLDLFSVLGLDEDEKWGSFSDADDSGVAFSVPPLPAQPSASGRVRRKRGDTIRAADFAQAPLSASFDGVSGSGLGGTQRPPPRRTRSGTVTQATSSGSGRMKHEGWPTIKMRTMAEPLRVEGDDADDELLLKDGDVVE